MSQQVWSTINPTTTSGTMLAAILTDFKDALMTGLAGTSRPSQLTAGGMWVDTTQQAAPNYYWSFKLWTGVVDIEVFRLNINTGFGGPLTSEATFEVRQISADTVGAIQALIKQRFASNGQILNGDTVGEIQFVGRTITSTNPVVAYMKWVATDDQLVSAYGGTFSFFTTPDAGSAIAEHLRFIASQVEPLVQLKINSLRLVSQNVATASSIIQLSAEKCIVEFTGSVVSDIKGLNSGQESKVVTLHNRSSVIVTLKHENASATAADRFHFPSSADYAIEIDGAISLIYSTADARWKLYSTHDIRFKNNSETITGLWSKWTAPTGAGKLNVTAYKKKLSAKFMSHSQNLGGILITKFGKIYTWGAGGNGRLGLGDVLNRSSPVAVIGGLNFSKISESNEEDVSGGFGYTSALGTDGVLYGWGLNSVFALGTGDSIPRSSPVAVLGGFSFVRAFMAESMQIGMLADGSIYAWGRNTKGGLGNGDTANRSSPVPVIGGFKFQDIKIGTNGISAAVFGIERTTGILYGWGENDVGQLGLNDRTARSSPVAVTALAGVKIKKLVAKSASTTFALTEDGNLYGWGANSVGQLGQNNLTDKSTPTLILAGISDFWSNGFGTIAKTTAGLYYGWGLNTYGLLGIGDLTNRSSPIACAALASYTIQDLKIIANNGFLWTPDGTMYGWGINDTGQLGDGTSVDKSSPVVALGGLKISEVSYLFADTPNGTLYARGDNNSPFGALGIGDPSSLVSSPVLVLGPAGVDSSYESSAYTIDVTPAVVYNLKLGHGPCFFGNTPIGSDIEKITIDYPIRGNT